MILKELIVPFATGLAIFLFGMQVMKIGFEHLFLDQVRKLLHHVTTTPLLGLTTGAVATAILQSSSAVSLIIIGLAHSKVLSLRQAISIILGVNIGTTLTTELLAFQIEDWGLYLFILGITAFIIPHSVWKNGGLVLGGFGLLLIGMNTMQSITGMLKQVGWIDSVFLFGSNSLMSGILAGTILTAIIQSSTITTVIAMNLIYDQLLPLSIAIAIVLGSNIGTCITAILGSIGTSRTSKQVALAHVLLNVGGVVLFFPFIPLLGMVVEWVSNYPMQQVAHAQTIFNMICSFVLLPFVHLFQQLIERLSKSIP